jgi:hypothetical protein
VGRVSIAIYSSTRSLGRRKRLKDQSLDLVKVRVVGQHVGSDREGSGRDPDVVFGDRSTLALEREPNARVRLGDLLVDGRQPTWRGDSASLARFPSTEREFIAPYASSPRTTTESTISGAASKISTTPSSPRISAMKALLSGSSLPATWVDSFAVVKRFRHRARVFGGQDSRDPLEPAWSLWRLIFEALHECLDLPELFGWQAPHLFE